jgi:hypothetical protein
MSGLFRNDLSQYLDDAQIDAAINHGHPAELPPQPGVRYVAFTDASAGRADAFTLAIGHQDGDRFIADVVRGRRCFRESHPRSFDSWALQHDADHGEVERVGGSAILR